MNKEKIEKIWIDIIHSGKGEFEYQLLSKQTIPQLNIGYNKKGQRCLILELPLKFDKVFQQFEKENLSLKYFSNERCLFIVLNDDYFKDLFDSKDPIINFLNEFIKIIFCFLIFALIIFFLIKIKFLNKESAKNAYAKPVLDFLNRYGSKATSILLLIGLYRISDVVLGVMANIFYIEKGFSIAEIATYSKFFGTIATIVGGIIGGLASVHLGVMRSLFIGALISALSNLLFAWLAIITADVKILAFVITADNIASGFAGATFIVYLSALTSIKFTATQYALFSSAMLFLPKLIAGYAGGFVNLFGYPTFFVLSAIIGVPVLFLIIWINKTVKINKR